MEKRANELSESEIHQRALLVGAFILLLFLLSIAALLFSRQKASRAPHPTAYIYSGGIFLRSIDLSAVQEAYSFTISSANGGKNTVEVRPGSIGILSADCPDKLCVHQGFLSAPLFPLVCLPNQLVIEIRDGDGASMPDAIAY